MARLGEHVHTPDERGWRGRDRLHGHVPLGEGDDADPPDSHDRLLLQPVEREGAHLRRRRVRAVHGRRVVPTLAARRYPVTFALFARLARTGRRSSSTGVWVAYKPIEQVRIGLGLEALVGTFDSTVVSARARRRASSARPRTRTTTPTASSRSVPSSRRARTWGRPSCPIRTCASGCQGSFPSSIDAPATVTVKLPNAVEFDQAVQQGTTRT